jgi:hypothetical protein
VPDIEMIPENKQPTMHLGVDNCEGLKLDTEAHKKGQKLRGQKSLFPSPVKWANSKNNKL